MSDYELTQIETSPCWYVTWTVNRRSKRVSTRTADRKRAEQFLAAFRLRYDEAAVDAWSLPDVLDWYYDEHANALESADDAKAAIKRLTDFFGVSDPTDIDPSKIDLFVKHRRKDKVSNDTVNRDLSVLSAALNRANHYKKIGQPFKIYLLPRAEPRERYLSRTELALGYAYMWWRTYTLKRYHHVLLFTRIAMATGARPTAILQLTWDRVDFARRTIWFPVPGRRQTKKRRTVISFGQVLNAALKAAKKRADEREKKTGVPATHVIEFEGQPVTQIRKSITKSFEAVGVMDVSPYTLRHTFATWAAQGGAHISNLGGAMGHSNPSTTAKYVKYQPEAFKSVVKASRRKTQ